MCEEQKNDFSNEIIHNNLDMNIYKSTETDVNEDIESISSLEEDSSDEENDLTMFFYINNHLCFEYFVGYEIAALLGYKNPNDVIIKNVSKSNQLVFREYPGVKKPELDPRTILITHDGAVEMLIKTRKRISPDVAYILKKFNIVTTNRKCLTKEQQTLSAIADAFKSEKIEDQYKVGPYFLDMFFPEYKIVNECDENGHGDRKPCDERERMDFINNALGIDDSHWIRFNPDEKDFDVNKVIAQIHNFIKIKISAKIVEPLTLTIPKRRCDVCQENKYQTPEFFKKSGTGLTRTCIDCKTDITGKEKPTIQYNLDGTFIKRFDSVKDAAAETKLAPSQISATCRNVIKSAGNFLWKFEEDVMKVGDEETKDGTDGADGAETKNIEAISYKTKKQVAQYNKDGTFIKTYESGNEAARQIGASNEAIKGAIRNNFVSHGYLWRYVENGVIIPKIPEVTEHRKFMKQVEIYDKDGNLSKSFLSITQSAKEMKVNISMCRKYLSGLKGDPSGLVWKFKETI